MNCEACNGKGGLQARGDLVTTGSFQCPRCRGTGVEPTHIPHVDVEVTSTPVKPKVRRVKEGVELPPKPPSLTVHVTKENAMTPPDNVEMPATPAVRVSHVGMPRVSEDFMIQRPIMLEISNQAFQDLLTEHGREGLYVAIGQAIVRGAQEHDDKIKAKHTAANEEVNDKLKAGESLSKDDIADIMKRHGVPGVDPKILMGSVVDLGHEQILRDDKAVPILVAAQEGYTKDQVITSLFDLLDDIDTLNDICKSNGDVFRSTVNQIIERRWETGITVDRAGQEILLKDMHPIPKMTHEDLIALALPPKPEPEISKAAVGCGRCFMAYPEDTGRCSQCGSANLVPGTVTQTPPPPEQGYTNCTFKANEGGGWDYKEPWTRSESDPKEASPEDPQEEIAPSAAPVLVSGQAADHVGCPECELIWGFQDALDWPIPLADLESVDVRMPCPRCTKTLQRGVIQGVQPHAECKEEAEVRFFPEEGNHWTGTKEVRNEDR